MTNHTVSFAYRSSLWSLSFGVQYWIENAVTAFSLVPFIIYHHTPFPVISKFIIVPKWVYVTLSSNMRLGSEIDATWRHHDKEAFLHYRAYFLWRDASSAELWSFPCSWWRHQMETFSALLAICAGNSPVHGEFPTQRPVTRTFYVFFDLRPNKRLSKQSWWWFETPSRPLWRHRNVCASK